MTKSNLKKHVAIALAVLSANSSFSVFADGDKDESKPSVTALSGSTTSTFSSIIIDTAIDNIQESYTYNLINLFPSLKTVLRDNVTLDPHDPYFSFDNKIFECVDLVTKTDWKGSEDFSFEYIDNAIKLEEAFLKETNMPCIRILTHFISAKFQVISLLQNIEQTDGKSKEKVLELLRNVGRLTVLACRSARAEFQESESRALEAKMKFEEIKARLDSISTDDPDYSCVFQEFQNVREETKSIVQKHIDLLKQNEEVGLAIGRILNENSPSSLESSIALSLASSLASSQSALESSLALSQRSLASSLKSSQSALESSLKSNQRSLASSLKSSQRSLASSQSALASSIALNQDILNEINNDSFLFKSAQDRQNEREQQAVKRQISRKLALQRQVVFAQTNAAGALAQESPRTSETTSHVVPKESKRLLAVTTTGPAFERALHNPNLKTQDKKESKEK